MIGIFLGYGWAVILGGIIMTIDDVVEVLQGTTHPSAPFFWLVGIVIAISIDIQWCTPSSECGPYELKS